MLIFTCAELRLISFTAETTNQLLVTPENDRIGLTTEKCFMVCLVRLTALGPTQVLEHKGVTNCWVLFYYWTFYILHTICSLHSTDTRYETRRKLQSLLLLWPWSSLNVVFVIKFIWNGFVFQVHTTPSTRPSTLGGMSNLWRALSKVSSDHYP